jgi:hypothetical protein
LCELGISIKDFLSLPQLTKKNHSSIIIRHHRTPQRQISNQGRSTICLASAIEVLRTAGGRPPSSPGPIEHELPNSQRRHSCSRRKTSSPMNPASPTPFSGPLRSGPWSQMRARCASSCDNPLTHDRGSPFGERARASSNRERATGCEWTCRSRRNGSGRLHQELRERDGGDKGRERGREEKALRE